MLMPLKRDCCLYKTSWPVAVARGSRTPTLLVTSSKLNGVAPPAVKQQVAALSHTPQVSQVTQRPPKEAAERGTPAG